MQLYHTVYYTLAVIYIFFGIYIMSKNRHSTLSKALVALCLALFCWALGYAYMFTAPDMYIANIWRLVAAIGWCSFFNIWLTIVILIRNNNKKEMSSKLILLLSIPSVIFYINTLLYEPSQVIYRTNNCGWSDRYPVNLIEILYSMYIIAITITQLVIFYKIIRTSKSPREVGQAKIIGITILIPVIFGIITDIILPLVHIQTIPLGIVGAPIGLLGIWYSINKYKIMVIEPNFISENALYYVFKNAGDPIFIIGEDLRIKRANSVAAESISNEAFEILIKEYREVFTELIKKGRIENIEVMLVNNVIYELSGKIIHDEFNSVIGIVVLLHNISERKGIENILRNTNYQLEGERRRLNTLVDELPGLVCIRKINGEIVLVNRNFRNVYGEPNNEYCYKIFFDKSTPCSNCKALSNSECSKLKEWKITIKDGIFEVYQQPFQGYDGEQLYLMQLIDITKREIDSEEIARLDRLNIVGELSASLAHEVRNPLTTVKGFLQLLGNRNILPQDKEYFELMIEELDRANSIVTEFLSITKPRATFEKLRLDKIIDAIYPLIRSDAINQDKQVEYIKEAAPELLLNEKEIRQLVLNLTRNGLESMGQNGLLRIKLGIEENTVVLTIQDQGNGIKPEILEKIGTPFMTTKEGGTGLGLTTCFSIAERHKAKIDVTSSPSGTTFYVRFKTNN